jgi:hypothetical protein
MDIVVGELAVLVALLTSLDVLLMSAAARRARLLLARAGRRRIPGGIVHVLVALLARLDVLFVGSTLICHWIILLGFLQTRPRAASWS